MVALCSTDMSSHAEKEDSESLCTNVLLQRRLGKCSKRACSVKGLTKVRGTDVWWTSPRNGWCVGRGWTRGQDTGSMARLMSRHQSSPPRKVSYGHDVRSFCHFLRELLKSVIKGLCFCFCEVRNVATRRQQHTGLHFVCRQQTTRSGRTLVRIPFYRKLNHI